MKQIVFLKIFILFLAVNSNGQITKKNWIVGGSGRLAFQKQTLNGSEAKGTNISVLPTAGYFFIDKFAGGLKARLAFDRVEFNGGVSKVTQFGVGPFFRYYFLDPDNRINLFAETAYQYLHFSGNNASSNSANVFTFSAGPVIYFNTSVGIEFTANYELYDNKDAGTNAKTFFLSIGFQIHLEKEKNH